MQTPNGMQYDDLYKMMHLAFIEIRANDENEKNYAISNMFHNVPMMMRNNRSLEKIWRELVQKAERTKTLEYLKHLANDAIKQRPLK